MTWEEFASRVRTDQIGFMGEPNEVRPGRGEFHENPTSCICEKSKAKAREVFIPHSRNKSGKEDSTNNDTGDLTDDQLMEDEQEWSDMDYAENAIRIQERGLPNETDSDPNVLLKPEQPELEEELFSD